MSSSSPKTSLVQPHQQHLLQHSPQEISMPQYSTNHHNRSKSSHSHDDEEKNNLYQNNHDEIDEDSDTQRILQRRTTTNSRSNDDRAAITDAYNVDTNEENNNINDNNDENDTSPPASYTFILCCSALGGALFGYDSSNINAAAFLMSRSFDFELKSWKNGLLVAIGVAGAFFGSAFAGWSGERFGRKKTLLLADIFFIVGSVVLAAAPDYWTVIAGRVLVGIGIGLSSVITPMFLAEITSPERRGPAVTLNNVALTGFQFVAAVVGIAFVAPAPDNDPNPDQWRYIFALGAAPAVLQIILLFCIPESPRWLISTRKPRQEQESAVRRLGLGDPAKFIAEHEEQLSRTPERGMMALVSDSSLRKRLLIACGLQFFQQVDGINIAMYFTSTVLENAGFSGEKDPIYFAAPLAFINCAFTFVSFCFVEKVGRRPLLLASIVGCFVAIVAFSVVGFVSDEPYPKSSAIGFICCLGVYVLFFSFGPGCLPWVLLSELTPLDFRTSGAAIATMVNWGSNTAVSQVFPIVLGEIGLPWTFMIVAGFILMSFFFVYFCVPETKGLSLEEIDQLFVSSEKDDDEVRNRNQSTTKDEERRAMM